MEYKQQYYDIKAKYLKLKNEISHAINQTGGVTPYGSYVNESNNKMYKVYRTKESRIFSFREIPFRDVEKNDITADPRKPNKDKVLYINDLRSFNAFTGKYGRYDTWNLFVAWDEVANDFKGFYLNVDNKDLFLNVYAKARKGPYRMGSWWAYEYEGLATGVMLFR